MKYSLRSLMLNAVLAVPFLVFGAFALYSTRKSLDYYEDYRAINSIDWEQLKAENQLTLMDQHRAGPLSTSQAPAPNPPKQ
jgi:hypothetical protein